MAVRQSAVGIWTVLVLLSSPTLAFRPARGYEERACGFDLDDDGIIGEVVDDCRVCDGLTADPDGDGVDEDLIYVDADVGSDLTGSGSPENPFKTIQFAWGIVADGPSDGAEDIICFRGTAHEASMTPGVSGLAGVKVRERSRSESRSFELARDPTMLIGWDADHDGCYPPYDDGESDVVRCGIEADTAVLDGAGLDRAFVLNTVDRTAVSFVEMAHFAVRDYGRFTTGSSGFMDFGRSKSSTPSHHLYLHDLEIDGINRDRGNDGTVIAFSFFIGSMPLSHVLLENLSATEFGSYFARGSFSTEQVPDGPIRFQKLTLTAHGCDSNVCGAQGFGASVTGFKLWGIVDGLELLDSVLDANLDVWVPREAGPTNGFIADACTQDIVVRNNLFRNWRTTLIAKGADGFCVARPVDDLLFEANQVIVDHGFYSAGPSFARAIGVDLDDDGLSSPEASIADVTIVNNFFYAAAGWRAGFLSEAGNATGEPLGTVVVAGNSFYGAPQVPDWGIFYLRDSGVAFPLSRFRVLNNIFSGLGDGSLDSVVVEYEPSGELIVDRNTYDPAASFAYRGATFSGLGEWRAATGLDMSSRSCSPLLKDPPLGDLHLIAADLCATEIGGDISPYLVLDIDGNPRVSVIPPAGADDLAAILVDGFEDGDLRAWSKAVPSG